jgi:hypothetical protein
MGIPDQVSLIAKTRFGWAIACRGRGWNCAAIFLTHNGVDPNFARASISFASMLGETPSGAVFCEKPWGCELLATKSIYRERS